jgi:hypothetical protein
MGRGRKPNFADDTVHIRIDDLRTRHSREPCILTRAFFRYLIASKMVKCEGPLCHDHERKRFSPSSAGEPFSPRPRPSSPTDSRPAAPARQSGGHGGASMRDSYGKYPPYGRRGCAGHSRPEPARKHVFSYVRGQQRDLSALLEAWVCPSDGLSRGSFICTLYFCISRQD